MTLEIANILNLNDFKPLLVVLILFLTRNSIKSKKIVRESKL
ncbi:hypothetical protein A3Q56_08443, partial [Intoshia linei]